MLKRVRLSLRKICSQLQTARRPRVQSGRDLGLRRWGFLIHYGDRKGQNQRQEPIYVCDSVDSQNDAFETGKGLAPGVRHSKRGLRVRVEAAKLPHCASQR